MAEYFSHDYDTRSDERIIDLLSVHGWEGYGLYWAIVELLYQNDGFLQLFYKRIAFALRANESNIKSIIEDFDLFVIDGDKFYSESVIRRLKQREEKSAKARKSAYARWGDANALRTESDGNAIKERKGKEIKEKKEIPAFEDVKKYAIEKKPNIDIAALRLKFESWKENEWCDGNGKPIKNWKSKILATLPYIKVNAAGGRNINSEKAPENYGVLPKGDPMPDSLRKKFKIK
jgi:hypothetical protein